MGIEASPRNEFRAFLRGDARKPVVVADKSAQKDPSADGLIAVKVPRSEGRRTNQRSGDRHRLSDEQALIRRKDKSHVVELINLSQGGAMVSGKVKCKLWDKVELVLGEGGHVECAVRWIRDGRLGLEFAHETQVDCDPETHDELLRQVIRKSFPNLALPERDPSTPQPSEQKRGVVRHPLIWNGVLHHDYEWETVRLRNISATGALVECSASLPVGVNVFLDLEQSGRMAAVVSWSRGNQTGLKFAEEFDVNCLSKSTPVIASKTGPKSHFAPYGRECDQSPWAPQWGRLSIDELGAELGG